MKITASGWSRDHGTKNLLSGKLESIEAVGEDVTYSYNDIVMRKVSLNDVDLDYIDIAGRASITMNGDYLLTVRLNKKDIAKLAAEMFRGKSFDRFVREINKIYESD